MLLRLFLVLLLSGGLWAEPSVYGSSASSDKQIKRNRTAIYKLKQQTAQLREEIEGLRSVIEGLNRNISQLKQKQGSSGDKKLLTDIANLIDKINQNYVSKRELDQALKRYNPPRVASSASNKSKPKTSQKPKIKSDGLSTASSSALYSKGVRLVNRKRYTEAKRRFDILAERHYKKAATHFYLGEIAYRTGKYTRAIDEYKQSAEQNDNAAYMDTLLLHTGIAMEKNGEKQQAKRFFQAIVDGYPGTISAKVAKRHL
jgi:TolA-binding protein